MRTILITIITVFVMVFVASYMQINLVQQKPVVTQKLMQDTLKMDTVPMPKRQQVYKKQMTQQMSKMDSLLMQKKMKK